jgi:hypothetical protein
MRTILFIFLIIGFCGYSEANTVQDSTRISLDTLEFNMPKQFESEDSLYKSINGGISGNSHIELGAALVVVGLGLTFATDSMKEGSRQAYIFSGCGLAFPIAGAYEIFHGLIKKSREKRVYGDG